MVRTVMATLSLATAVALTAAFGAVAEPIVAKSAVSAVEVYPDGATVTRTLTAQVGPGESVVAIGNLPLGLDPNSVRVEGEGSAGLEIVSVDTRRVDPLPGDRHTEFDDRIDALKAERATLADTIETTSDQISYVKRIGDEAPRDLFSARREGGDGDWKGLLGAMGNELKQLRRTLRETRKKDKGLADEIARLERQRGEAWPADRPTMEAAVTLVAADGAQSDVALTLHYTVNDASWTPVYDARLALSGDKPALEIVRRAIIRQSSGEAWDDVAVTLSTARPGGGTTAPDLRPVALRLAPPRPVRRNTFKMETRRPDADAGALAGAMAEAPAPVMVKEVHAAIETRGFDVLYQVPGKVTVAGDGTSKTVRITTDTPEPRIAVRAVPEQDTTAYLSVRFDNAGPGPILPGDIQLFRDGVFVGTGHIGLVAPGEEARIGFGSDPAVVVKRTVLTREEGERGILTSDKTDTRRYRITVTNRHIQPVGIEIEDRLPTPENEKITVEPIDDMTKPTVRDPDDRKGVVVWSGTYKPDETREILFGYVIRWPAEEQLVWVERR